MVPNIAYFIISVDVAVLLILLETILRAGKKCYTHYVTKPDYNFYMFLFVMGVCFIIGNSMAMYTDITRYFVKHMYVPEDISLARYVDRFAMFCAYIGFNLLSRKYIPNWFSNSSPNPQSQSPSMTSIAYFPEDMNDKVVEFDGVAVIPHTPASDYPTVNTDFYIDYDPNNEPCLCIDVSTEDFPTLKMVSVTSQMEYQPQPKEFIGGRPPRKPR